MADKGIRKWLESFPKIGPVTADAYVRRVGGTLEAVRRDMEKGGPVLKLVCKGADHKAIVERFASRTPLLVFLEETCGLSESDALRVPANVDEETVRADPYTALAEILGFAAIDRLFLTRLGGTPLAPVRVTALAAHILETEFGTDMYVPLPSFAARLHRVSAVGNAAKFMEALAEAPDASRLVLHENDLYTRANYEAEMHLPGLLRSIAARRGQSDTETEPVYLEGLDPDQRRAVERMLEGGLVCIAGQAGSGKTQVATVFTQIVENVRLLAFTGAAAANIARRTGLAASTIDAFLVASLPDPAPTHILVDEASMVSAAKLHALLRKAPGVHLFLLGDPAQLPPIGQGEPFRQMCEGGGDAVVCLTQNHRQEGAEAVDFLRGIAVGRWVAPPAQGAVRLHTLHERDTVITQVLEVIEDPAGEHTQFIAGTNATCALMNNALQPLANPNVPQVMSVGARVYSSRFGGMGRIVARDGNSTYLVGRGASADLAQAVRHQRYEMRPLGLVRGDRVVLTRNHNDLGLVNGSIGTLMGSRGGGRSRVAFSERGIEADIETKYLQHAYCMTVHKMQGRERPRIVYLAWDAFGDRRLVYSACTRFVRELHVFHCDWDRLARLVEKPVPRSASRIDYYRNGN